MLLSTLIRKKYKNYKNLNNNRITRMRMIMINDKDKDDDKNRQEKMRIIKRVKKWE